MFIIRLLLVHFLNSCSNSKYFKVPMLNYTQACLAEDKCDTRYNLTCLASSQTCGCLTTTTQYYNGSSCSYLLGYLDTCSNSMLCNHYLGLSCSSSKCNCNSTQFFNGTMCGN